MAEGETLSSGLSRETGDCQSGQAAGCLPCLLEIAPLNLKVLHICNPYSGQLATDEMRIFISIMHIS